MTALLTRLADRALVRIAPRTEATAGCSYVYELCYCASPKNYFRRCMYSCPGVPNHCYSCAASTLPCP